MAKELKDLEQHKLIKHAMIEDDPIIIYCKLDSYVDTLTLIIYSLKDWGVNHRKNVTGRE